MSEGFVLKPGVAHGTFAVNEEYDALLISFGTLVIFTRCENIFLVQKALVGHAKTSVKLTDQTVEVSHTGKWRNLYARNLYTSCIHNHPSFSYEKHGG